MSTTKKRKLEVDLLARLRQLRSSIVQDVSSDTFADQLDSIITTFETQVNTPQVPSLFSYFVCKVSLLLVALILCHS
jgi:hypothetical protein